MNAMIFAAGLGTRLKPFTDSHPKALLPLGGKTLLQRQIERLQAAGITDIVVNVHHHAEQIIDYLAAHRSFGCRIRISDERDALLDTGGGLRKAMHSFGEGDETPWLVCNVDILSNIRLPQFLSDYHAADLATLVVSRRQTQRYLLFDGEQRLRGWTNLGTGEVRPQAISPDTAAQCDRLAFSGMQVVSPRLLPYMDEVAQEKGDKFSLIDLYLHICERHPAESLRAYVPADYRMMDVGKTAQLEEAERFAEGL
ncbi:MAG: nucleotidyltransferase family protein [Paludibacteraceae bacterium]